MRNVGKRDQDDRRSRLNVENWHLLHSKSRNTYFESDRVLVIRYFRLNLCKPYSDCCTKVTK
jgi:hypothetical protein